MKLHALLAWYAEPTHMLIRAIRSCEGVVDHLIAIDGPYETFPHDTTHSTHEETAAIRAACHEAGIALTLYQPGIAWRNEGYKRTTLFQAAINHGTVGEDWVLPLDADEELVGADYLRDYLECDPPACDIAIYYNTPPAHPTTPQERALLDASTDTRSHYQTRLLRLRSGMHVVQPSHWQFASDEGPIRHADDTLDPALFHILHHTTTRTTTRMQHKQQHVEARNARGET